MKRTLLVFLILVLITALVIPGVALAQNKLTGKSYKSLDLSMNPTSIDQPSISTAPWPQSNPGTANSWPIFDNVNGTPTVVGWVVDHRTIYGTVTGDANGQFTLTYGGILDSLQSGSMHGTVVITTTQGNVYFQAEGTSEAIIKETYTFEEIASWCQAAGLTSGMFFAAFYGNGDLGSLPDGQLVLMYGTVLPLLPKTLQDDFKGTATVESGTGYYAAIHGTAQFHPATGIPIILSVYPNQHVYNITGTIVLRGFKSIERARISQDVIGKVKDAIQQWFKDKKR